MMRHARALALLLFAAGLPAAAQRLEVHVTYVSADYVYLDAGREQGLHVGDSLVVRSAARNLGRLFVSGTSRSRSVTTFVGEPFPVAVGDTLLVDLPGTRPQQEPARPDAEAATRAIPPRPSLLEVPAVGGADRAIRSRPRPRLSGRVRFDLAAMRTETLWRSSTRERSVRTFYTPSAALRLGVTGLPGGWDLGLDLNVTRRFSTRDIVSPEGLARIYRVSARRAPTGSPFRFEAGRFQPDGDPQRTFWDGAQASWRSAAFEAGLALGLEPDRYNGFVQTGVPKAAGFVAADWRIGPARMRSQAGGASVRPTNGWLDHTYVGFEHELRIGDARFSADVQVDRDPEEGGWTASRRYLRASLPLGAGLVLSGRHQDRRPYAYWRSFDIVGTRRTQEAVSLAWSGTALSLHAGWNGTRAAAGVATDAYSVSGRWARVPYLGVAFSASASLWRRTGFDSRYVTVGLARPVPGGRLAATWQHYSFGGSPSYAASQTIGLQWVGTVGRRLSASLGGRSQFGSATRGITANGSVSFSF